MRLFIAINFEENMIDALCEMQDDLRQSGVTGNYTRPENMHTTLAFIGEYDDPEQIEEVLKGLPLRSFNIKLTGCSPFKDMYFGNIEENENLHDYVKRLRHALAENDIPFDRKKFLPHITLVRRAEKTKSIPILSEDQYEESMRVKGISLMKSERGKHGMIYTEIGYVAAF